MDLTDFNVENSTQETSGTQTITYSYTTSLVDSSSNTTIGTLVQTFSVANATTQSEFAGTSFSIPAGAVKWSVDLDAFTPVSQGLSVSYQLPVFSLQSSAGGQIIAGGKSANITTYFLTYGSSGSSSGSETAVEVQVFDVALVDDATYEPVTSEISGPSNDGTFTLVLTLPAFTTSLKYDPVVGLASLQSSSSSGGGGGSSDNVGLIVGLAVGLPLGLLLLGVLIAAVIGGGFLVWRKYQQRGKKTNVTHFDDL